MHLSDISSISIHTLRVEGDICPAAPQSLLTFLSTPSVWRVTAACQCSSDALNISIHTLRVEGDSKKQQNCVAICIKIAIVKSVLYKKSF